MNSVAKSGRSLARWTCVLGALVAIASVGCDKKAEGDEKKSKASAKEEKAKDEKPPPDFELTADKLSGAYAADPDATDKKYGSKKLRISGKIKKISIYDDKAFVTLDGASYDDSTKLSAMRKADGKSTTGSVEVSCNTKPGSKYLKMMATVAEKAMAAGGSTLPVGTIEGEYDKGYPLSGVSAAVDIKACALLEPQEK